MIADSGWWIALDLGDRRVWSHLEVLRSEGLTIITSAVVVAQVWRDGARQARLALVLQASDVVDLTQAEGRQVGVLLGDTGGHDVVDGHVALLADRHPDRLVATSDRGDLEALGVAPSRIIDT